MTDEELLKKQKQARAHAVRCGQEDQADDFAQDYAIALIRGWKQTIDQAWASFVRGELGDLRTPGGLARSQARFKTTRLDAPVGDEEGSTLNHELVAAPLTEPDPLRRPIEVVSGMTMLEERLYEDVFIDERPKREIAAGMGVTPARVSQLLGPIKNKIAAYSQLEELRDRMNTEENFGVFEMDWITL